MIRRPSNTIYQPFPSFLSASAKSPGSPANLPGACSPTHPSYPRRNATQCAAIRLRSTSYLTNRKKFPRRRRPLTGHRPTFKSKTSINPNSPPSPSQTTFPKCNDRKYTPRSCNSAKNRPKRSINSHPPSTGSDLTELPGNNL